MYVCLHGMQVGALQVPMWAGGELGVLPQTGCCHVACGSNHTLVTRRSWGHRMRSSRSRSSSSNHSSVPLEVLSFGCGSQGQLGRRTEPGTNGGAVGQHHGATTEEAAGAEAGAEAGERDYAAEEPRSLAGGGVHLYCTS